MDLDQTELIKLNPICRKFKCSIYNEFGFDMNESGFDRMQLLDAIALQIFRRFADQSEQKEQNFLYSDWSTHNNSNKM